MSNPGKETDVRALKMAVGLYVLLFALKLAVYFMTGVMSLLGEALHTLGDIFIYGFLLLAALYARKQPDEVHMFGYGRSENVAALVAATLFISFTSYKLYEESIPRLWSPGAADFENLSLAIGVIVVSMVVVAAPLITVLRQKDKGAAAKAQFASLVNDELGLIAVLIGTLFILWGQPIADPIATITVATIIAVDAVGLFRENLSFLLGRSPGQEYLETIKKTALSVPGVRSVHDLRAEYIGPETVHAGMHIEVASGMTVEEANRIAETVEKRVHEKVKPGYCVIHVDPAGKE